jgi:peptidoglycan/xylan/chitin deacetylase (PgdA/CDA1 family)
MTKARLDRFATLGLFWPMARFSSGVRELHIPILMYHAVREGSSDPRPYYEINVAPQVFAYQMRQLRDLGYRAVTIAQALDAIRQGAIGQKLVVITFDDGYRDFYESAAPILEECEFAATVFLMPGYMGEGAPRFIGRDCMSWREVRELQARGIHFESHTVTHPKLQFQSWARIEEELFGSKEMIEDRVGAPVRSFSYPHAFPEADHGFVRRLKDVLLKCGYENSVTTILGTARASSDRFLLPRLPVNHWDDPKFFRAKLEGGYNWLHSVQYVSKYLGKLRPAGRVQSGKRLSDAGA